MIHLNNVQFSYNNTAALAFDLHLESGSKTALIGASGSGKSTLLNLIAGFIYPNQGSIVLNDTEHTHSSPHQRPVSMLFQENNLFTHLSVWQNIGLGILPNLKLSTEQKQQLHNIADKMGLASQLHKFPEQLSGGQRQRVALARCLLRNQPILLLDEPFSALDQDLRHEMLALINQLTEEKQLTVLMVTHQPEELIEHVDNLLEIKHNRLVFTSSND